MSWSSPNWRSSSSPWQNEDEGTDSHIFRNTENDDDIEEPPLLVQSTASGIRNNSLASSTGSILPDIPDNTDLDDLNKIYEKIKKKRESYYWGRTAVMWGVGFMVYIALALIVNSQETDLPAPLLSNVTADHIFCEERAYQYLQHFGEEIGARPIGSVANRRASAYIYDTLVEMTQSHRDDKYPSISVRVLSEPGNTKYLNLLLNDTNGSNNKEMKRDADDDIWQNIYFDGIENIAVIVEGENGLNQSLLVVSHFDSSTLSPATTDDATGVSLSLELVHNLLHTERMKHTVIFLFTNAQEFGSLGAKSFIDLDPLSDTIAAFLNIDSVPSKRAVLLRSTGGWIDEVFMKSAPDPRANVMGHHALETGLFNMESDFFVLAKQWPGLDFTDYNHRKLQHTLDDTLEHYQPGSMQFLGNNILPTIKAIADGDWLEKEPDFEPNVYYSILGLFSTVYSTAASMRAHIVIAVLLVVGLGFMLFVKMRQYQLLLNKKNHPLKFLVFAVASLCLSLLTGILFSVLVALLLWEFNPMFYYSYPQLAIFAFGVPALLGMFSVQGVFHLLSRRRGVGIGLAEKHTLWAVTAMWAIVMCATASLTYDYGWTYPIFLFGLFSLIGLITQLVLSKLFSVVKRKFNLNSKVSSHSIGHEQFNEHKPLLDTELDQEDVHSSSIDTKRRNYHFYKSLGKILVAAIVFLVATIVPCLVLFELTQFFITFVSAEIGHVTMATIVALVAFVTYINFFPIARRGGNYWLVIMFLLFGTAFLLVFASVYHEAYTGNSPLGLSVKHRFLALHHRTSNSAGEVKDHSEVILSTTFPVNLRSIIEKINFTDCHFNDNDPTECRIESGPPNAFIPYLGVKNSTLNGTVHDVLITGITPGSFVHLFEFPNLKPSMVQVNNQTIDQEDVLASFYYFVATDYRWTLRMQYNGTEPIMLRLHSHFNSLIHSAVVDTLVDELPDWVTLVGSGTGLVVTETNWSFS